MPAGVKVLAVGSCRGGVCDKRSGCVLFCNGPTTARNWDNQPIWWCPRKTYLRKDKNDRERRNKLCMHA